MKKLLSIFLLVFSVFLFTACDNNKTPVDNEPTQLSKPVLALDDNVVSWSKNDNAIGYVVSQNDVDQEMQIETSYTISKAAAGRFDIKVKAISADKTKYLDSEYSNTITYVVTEDQVDSNKPETPDTPDTPVGPVVQLEPATLYAVGDSTLSSFTDSYYYPRYGYATQLDNYFDSKLTINNLALSGRSSKSFIVEENYTTLKNSIKEGDYLLIGFGHNDQKSDDAARFTDATKPITDETSFKYSLYENYIKLAESVGATPILCTPVVRANPTNDYAGSSAHITATGDYTTAIIELGQEKNVTVINLTELTKAKYSAIGYDEAIYYHAMTNGKDENGTIVANTATVDKTHLNIYGAKYVAYLVASELAKTENKLGTYVKADIKEPTKANDLVANPNYTLQSYQAPDLINYEPLASYQTTTAGWYGTAFGDTGGSPSAESNGYLAHETSTGVFEVGQYKEGSNKGKFSGTSDGFAFLFKQVSINDNFTLTANAKVIKTAGVKQAGFGLMLRDDAYINLTAADSSIISNYVAAGFITSESNMNVLFSREAATLKKGDDVINSLYKVEDTVSLKIVRLGQSITTEVTYNGTTYSKTYYDFDLVAVDNEYMYVGMFANRGTVVEFTNVVYKFDGTSQGA